MVGMSWIVMYDAKGFFIMIEDEQVGFGWLGGF